MSDQQEVPAAIPLAIPPVVYSVEEAAKALRLSREMLYELIRSRQLRSIKVGRRRLVPVSALTEFVEGGAA